MKKSTQINYVKPAFILIMDVLISLASSMVAVLVVRWLTEPVFNFMHYVLIWLTLAIVGSLIGFIATGTYRIIVRHTTIKNLGKIALAVLIKDLLLLVCVLLNLFSIKNINGGLLLVLVDSLSSWCWLILIRVFIVIILENKSEDMEINVGRLSVLVYGTSNKSVALVTRLESSPHYKISGFIEDNPDMKGQVLINRTVFYADSAEGFEQVCRVAGGVNCVLFSRQEDADNQEGKLLKWCIGGNVQILVAPRIEDLEYGGITKKATDEISRYAYIPDGMSSFERNVKRAVDFLLAGLLIAVFSPAMLICYIAIKREDKGPALYRQERIGRFGKPFYILKFRSMRTDAEKYGPALYAGDDDPRLTKVGKFLRVHHLDELPQLFNVFRGDMAFVGYRPERKFYIDQIMEMDPRYYYLYQIRPGVTSYATLHNGYTDTLQKMVRRLQFDLYYLKNRSWWFDIKVLWQTFTSIIFGKKF